MAPEAILVSLRHSLRLTVETHNETTVSCGPPNKLRCCCCCLACWLVTLSLLLHCVKLLTSTCHGRCQRDSPWVTAAAVVVAAFAADSGVSGDKHCVFVEHGELTQCYTQRATFEHRLVDAMSYSELWELVRERRKEENEEKEESEKQKRKRKLVRCVTVLCLANNC